ncbi:MAG: hypothetical protein IH840_11650 [Candidatus Heimdallarchaeota archaeon]|nr:hypothetical protein [Candidatus Heimdallarchaeota archaeon]
MDNYQGNRAKLFQKSLKRKNVKAIWLPAWSPHLSLIENKFSLVKAEAIVSVIIKNVRALKMHATRWISGTMRQEKISTQSRNTLGHE